MPASSIFGYGSGELRDVTHRAASGNFSNVCCVSLLHLPPSLSLSPSHLPSALCSAAEDSEAKEQNERETELTE